MNKKTKIILSIIIVIVLITGIFLLIPKAPKPIHVDPIPQQTETIRAEYDFGHGLEGHFCTEKTKVQDCDTSIKCCDFSME